MVTSKIYAIEFKKFDGVANKNTYSEIINNLFNCGRIDLFPNEKIVKLNIRWGEIYCSCTNQEWEDLYGLLNNNGIHIKKDNLLRKLAEILSFFFLQPIELLINFFKKDIKK